MNTGDTHESFLTGETGRPLTTLTRISPTALGEFQVSQVADQSLSLPLSNTQVGNVIKDRFDTTLLWYLPTFTLADEPDAAFSFAATQTGVDASGNPFNRASVTFGIKKVVPLDVQLSQTQNPTMTFREIPLVQLTGTLSTTFKDANGVDQHNMYIGIVNVQTDGSLQLTFENILGVGVIVAYENLAQDGGAQVTLAASYAIWQLTWRRRFPEYHPELTGRENIYLNGAILGMSRSDIRKKFDEIVAFADLEAFLDTPVKRYSSGMYTRLAFTVAAHLEPDILIVDEVLAVGDVEFQRKCLLKMGQIADDGRTVVFVSHNMRAVADLCDRCIWIEGGHIVEDRRPGASDSQLPVGGSGRESGRGHLPERHSGSSG